MHTSRTNIRCESHVLPPDTTLDSFTRSYLGKLRAWLGCKTIEELEEH